MTTSRAMIKNLQNMGALPRIEIGRHRVCAGGYEARCMRLSMRWRAFVIELLVGRIDRTFDDIANSEENHEIAK